MLLSGDNLQMQLHYINLKKKKDRELGKAYIFNNYKMACEKFEDLERN